MTMKFILEKSLGVSVQSSQPGQVILQVLTKGEDAVSQEQITRQQSVALLPSGEVRDWAPQHFDQVEYPHYELIWEAEPELVILGTGAKQRFPDGQFMQQCAQAGIGLEVMNTTAACRTYNIVQSEGRKVMALLIIEA